MRRTIALMGAGLVVLLTASALVGVRYPTWKAGQITAAVRAIDWSAADDRTVKEFAKRFGGTFKCSGQECGADVETSNRLLKMLHLAPEIDFAVAVHTDAKKVFDVVVGIYEFGKVSPGTWSNITIQTFCEYEIPGMRDVHFDVQTSSAHKGRAVLVRMTTLATPEQRSLVQALDLRCLSRIGGCSQQELGPDVWKLGRVSYPMAK